MSHVWNYLVFDAGFKNLWNFSRRAYSIAVFGRLNLVLINWPTGRCDFVWISSASQHFVTFKFSFVDFCHRFRTPSTQTTSYLWWTPRSVKLAKLKRALSVIKWQSPRSSSLNSTATPKVVAHSARKSELIIINNNKCRKQQHQQLSQPTTITTITTSITHNNNNITTITTPKLRCSNTCLFSQGCGYKIAGDLHRHRRTHWRLGTIQSQAFYFQAARNGWHRGTSR